MKKGKGACRTLAAAEQRFRLISPWITNLYTRIIVQGNKKVEEKCYLIDLAHDKNTVFLVVLINTVFLVVVIPCFWLW